MKNPEWDNEIADAGVVDANTANANAANVIVYAGSRHAEVVYHVAKIKNVRIALWKCLDTGVSSASRNHTRVKERDT